MDQDQQGRTRAILENLLGRHQQLEGMRLVPVRANVAPDVVRLVEKGDALRDRFLRILAEALAVRP